MKILVLGCSGLIGYNLCRWWVKNPDIILAGYSRTNEACCIELASLGVDIHNHVCPFRAGSEMITGEGFDYVINCIGITKHDKSSSDLELLYGANVALPIFLAKLCKDEGTSFIQISTDCVFSGRRGGYTDLCIPDAPDDYGLSKALAESSLSTVSYVVRTSTVGFHPYRREGLFDWFVTNESNSCDGFVNAVYSGLPTTSFADDLLNFMMINTGECRVLNMSGPTINKYELLHLLNIEGNFKRTIVKKSVPMIDRSLQRSPTLHPLGGGSWEEMIRRELKSNGYI